MTPLLVLFIIALCAGLFIDARDVHLARKQEETSRPRESGTAMDRRFTEPVPRSSGSLDSVGPARLETGEWTEARAWMAAR